MNIIWHGHSCFEITGKDGTIVFDPYQANSVPGLNSLKLKANLVLCSHEHDDHNARNCVEVAPKDFKVTCIFETFPDMDDIKEALKYIERIKPRIVIPMHYRSHEFGYDVLSTNEEFIQQSSSVTYVDDCLEVNKDTKKQTVVFKKPRN